MHTETVETKSAPFIFVTRRCAMDEVGEIMGEAFAAMGGFLGKNQISPAGPPLAVYRDWDGKTIAVDVGFPVSEKQAELAVGDVHAGTTPATRALKALHRGSYSKLRETYGELEKQMGASGQAMPAYSWEVYAGDPDTTPEDELVTEIYMPLPEN